MKGSSLSSIHSTHNSIPTLLQILPDSCHSPSVAHCLLSPRTHLGLVAHHRPAVPHVGEEQVPVHHESQQRGAASRLLSIQQLRLTLE